MKRPTKGFVYAATGPDYTSLARRSVRNLRQAHPHVQVDLYTDQPIDDPAFNRIHQVREIWFRPKMEALLRSRFDVTVLLDADTIPLAGIDELFEAVTHCDLAAAQSAGRPLEVFLDQPEIPRAFPYLNAGVMVVRRSLQTQRLIREWREMVRANDLSKDQPPLRWLLFHRKIPFQVLPQEYNLTNIDLLDQWKPYFGAPRLLHVQDLHRAHPGDPETPFNLNEVLGPARRNVVRHKQKAVQKRLQTMVVETQPSGKPVGPAKRLAFLLQSLRYLLRQSVSRQFRK